LPGSRNPRAFVIVEIFEVFVQMAQNNQPPPAWATTLLGRIEAMGALTNSLQTRLDVREPRQRDRLPDVPVFEGCRKEYSAWATQLRAKLEIDMERDTDIVRFWYCHSRLRGKALAQVTPWVKSARQQGIESVVGLFTILDASYDTLEEVDLGEQQMLGLQQKSRSFAVYFAEFERHLIAANGVLWPPRVKRLFLESGFSQELRTALIPVEKPEKFEDYVAVVRRVALDLERGRSGKMPWSSSKVGSASYDTSSSLMDWETAPEVSISASGTRAKRVSKDILEARKKTGSCLRCGNTGHRLKDCEYLPPLGLEVNAAALLRPASNGRTRITPARVRIIEETLAEMDSDDFDEED
jgi:hypothetical protein